jgi:hypothetical protein
MKTYLRQLKRLANRWLPNYLAIHNADGRVRTNTVEVYVELLEEGTPTVRPTQAIALSDGLYKLLPTPNYDAENEIWAFLPGSIVRCRWAQGRSKELLVAVEQVG